VLLPSRQQFADANDFVEQFLDTLTLGIIPRADFINWSSIEKRLQALTPALDFYSQVMKRDVADIVLEIGDSILSHDSPEILVSGIWDLFGNTNNYFVTAEGSFELSELLIAFANGDELVARNFAQSLMQIGLQKITDRQNIKDVAFGVQIGLETDKRKNRGGTAFVNALKPVFAKAVQDVTAKTGIHLDLLTEQLIPYASSQSKTVDFYIVGENLKLGFEANFYTVSGSKPTEIKRSYNSVWAGLRTVGVNMVWITDGRGYKSMRKSLASAYEIVTNIYNLKQLQQHLANDLITVLQNDTLS
jgi:hypothetical protein